MKAKLLISAIFLCLVQLGFSQNRNASLQVDFPQTRASYAFQLSNETFTINNNVLLVDKLRSGFHPVQIFEFRGNRKILVYNGGVNLASNATTFSFFRNGNYEIFDIEPYFIQEEVIEVEAQVISEVMFQQLKNSVTNESFDSSRLELLESTLRNNHFYSRQIRDLMTLLSFDSGRLQFAKSAYLCVVDPENYFVVRNALTHSSSKTELTNYINSLPAY